MKESEHELIGQVHRTMERESSALADRFADKFKSSGRNDGDVISDLNRYFNMELSVLSVDTLDARECLIDGISPNRWFSYFTSHVLPLLVRFL